MRIKKINCSSARLRPCLHLVLGMLALLVSLAQPSSAAPKTLPTDFNIVLIVIDTLRADHLPAYGYRQSTAPFLSKLAAESVLFKRAIATSSWTSPATASIMTSLYPFQHGVLMGMNSTKKLWKQDPSIKLNRIPEEVTTIAEFLKGAGYRTFGVSDNGNICTAMGFTQGFDHFKTYKNKGAKFVNKTVLGWRTKLKQSPKSFLYLQYMDPHTPYLRHKPWYKNRGNMKDNTVAAYDSEINFLDKKIEALYTALGWDTNTLIIVSSDHGEEFWEHGKLGHGKSLFSEVLHVPLFFYMPKLGFKPQIVSTNVSPIDIAPTLRAMLGLKEDGALSGESLTPFLFGKATPKSERYFLGQVWKQKPDGREVEMTSITYKDWRYITSQTKDWKYPAKVDRINKMLFSLGADPLEQTSIIETHLKIKEQLILQISNMQRTLKKYPQAFSDYDFTQLKGVH
ncbi:sulfatase [Oligoflexia bacterium]|nr:sulfatase [Oligoflexia bacterium]